jgi:hypothetical protein
LTGERHNGGATPIDATVLCRIARALFDFDADMGRSALLSPGREVLVPRLRAIAVPRVGEQGHDRPVHVAAGGDR